MQQFSSLSERGGHSLASQQLWQFGEVGSHAVRLVFAQALGAALAHRLILEIEKAERLLLKQKGSAA